MGHLGGRQVSHRRGHGSGDREGRVGQHGKFSFHIHPIFPRSFAQSSPNSCLDLIFNEAVMYFQDLTFRRSLADNNFISSRDHFPIAFIHVPGKGFAIRAVGEHPGQTPQEAFQSLRWCGRWWRGATHPAAKRHPVLGGSVCHVKNFRVSKRGLSKNGTARDPEQCGE